MRQWYREKKMTFKLLLETRREDKKNPHQNRRYEKPDLWKHTLAYAGLLHLLWPFIVPSEFSSLMTHYTCEFISCHCRRIFRPSYNKTIIHSIVQSSSTLCGSTEKPNLLNTLALSAVGPFTDCLDEIGKRRWEVACPLNAVCPLIYWSLFKENPKFCWPRKKLGDDVALEASILFEAKPWGQRVNIFLERKW